MSVMQTRVAMRGKNMTLKEWAKELHITPKAIEARYIRGLRGESLFKAMRDYASESGKTVQRVMLDAEKAKLAEDYKMVRVAYEGRNLMLCEWADRLGRDYVGMATRYAKGKRGKALLLGL